MNNNWTTRPLQEVCNFQNGYAFRNKDYVDESEGKYEIFRMGNISRGGGFNPNASKVFVGSSVAEPLGRFLLNKHDILMCMTDMKASMALLGHTALLPIGGKYLVNQRVGRITVSKPDVLDTTYLYYYSNSPDYIDYLRARANSGVQVNLSTEEIINSPIIFPDFPTQRKIASILSAYDDLIENNTRRIAILEEMAQAIYREWFVNFRFPGHENVKLVDSPLGKIPEGWEACTIKDVCESTNYGFTASASQDEIGPKFLRITDIVPSTISWENVPFCEMEDSKVAKYTVEEGDVVVARTGATTGYAKRLNKRHPLTVYASYLVRLRPIQRLGKLFLGIIVESDDYKRFIKANLSGAAQPQANAQVLSSFSLPVPGETLIRRFDERVEPMLDQKEILEQKNRNLRSTRDLVLPKLISGKLDVADLDIDSGLTAEALEDATA